MLVTTVLRPEHREHGELEIVRRPTEQFPDSRELPVGETERAVEWLQSGGAQGASVSAPGGRPIWKAAPAPGGKREQGTEDLQSGACGMPRRSAAPSPRNAPLPSAPSTQGARLGETEPPIEGSTPGSDQPMKVRNGSSPPPFRGLAHAPHARHLLRVDHARRRLRARRSGRGREQRGTRMWCTGFL